MFKKILIVVVLLIGGILIFAATRPDTFRIERSASIKAKPEKVFALVNDFHNWTSWSPWEKIDPELKRTFSGKKSGKDAAYAWEGNKDVGSGSMLITESVAPTKITIKLDFIKPFEAHNVTEFVFDTKGDSTNITWVMTGENNFIGKLMSIFMNMDKMVGKDFEKGLVNLKTAVEK
jgi:hypothetical protein